ncbi:MAG: penicillin-binding transpeptidase domain-containing protein [Aminipila sp.]
MEKVLRTRYGQIVAVVSVLMIILVIRLFSLTVIQNENWKEKAQNISTRSIATKAPRGEIFDRYGRVIAGNKQAFTLQINAGDYSNEELNSVCSEVVRILEKNNETYFDNLPIIISGGRFIYTYQQDIEEWLIEQEMPRTFSAQQAFDELRVRYEIDETLDKYEAQSELQNLYKVYPPISVKNMKFSKDLDKESFLGRYGLDKKTLTEKKQEKTELTAEDAFYALREKFEIDPSISNEDARKIMVIRNELKSMGYRKYLPADIAKGISDSTIIEIEERSSEMPQVKVVSETMRFYPNANTAAHILGYMGQISERDKEYYVDTLGYNANDLIGQDGIESAYETTLKGTNGIKTVQVNAAGELVRVISETEPQKGKDVYLTVDLELQKTAEDALEQALKQIQVGGTFKSEFGNYNYSKSYRNANVGAVVAIEVETGDVLAMASAPDFDPNLFANGISKEDWNSLQSVNPRDYMSPAPLYNVATRTPVQPGSTFKMVTATAALESGLDPNRKLYDGGRVMVGNRPYACLIWHRGGGSHGSVNLAEALEVSCNYYFYDIATGKDYYKGVNLGYRTPISIDVITSYAEQYGLGKPTGIEIPERVVGVPTAEKKMAQQKASLKSMLESKAEKYFKASVVADKEKLEKSINTIVSWTEENPTKNEIIKRFNNMNLGLKDKMIDPLADLCKYTYFNYANWTLGDEFNIAIGQGENSYTPLQMANYIATIGNHGVHNKVSLIKAIEDREPIEKEAGTKIDLSDDKHLDSIIEGMKRVVSGPKGSLRGIFANFPVEVAGKTGTAERSGKMHPPDEVEYIQKHLRQINPKLSWNEVETEMKRLMKKEPNIYRTKDGAVRQAVINLSNGTVDYEKIDVYKSNYDNFAWVLTMAPADEPKIAVAVMIVQGGTAGYAAPVAREVIGKYLQLDKTYEDFNLNTTIQ